MFEFLKSNPATALLKEDHERVKVLFDRFNNVGGGEGDYQVIMAGTLLLVIPMVLLFAVFQKYFIRGISVQGRKG